MNKVLIAIAIILLGCVPLVLGCGGGSSQSGSNASNAAGSKGSLQFNITWPTASRVIPAAAESLVISLTSNGQPITTRVIARPPAGTNTSQVRFDALTPGIVTVTVTAFPNPDGTGVAQAAGAATVAIISGVTSQVNIDPNSTVDHLDATPNPLVTIPLLTKPITVSPRDSQDNLVLVSPGSLQWTTSDPTVVTVDTAGTVTAVALGSATVRVTDTESGKTTTVAVQVVPPIVIVPQTKTLSITDQAQFTASVTDLASPNVTWSVLEGKAGGTIDSEGNYTAPTQSGTFHVIAASVSNPTITASAVVTVQSGSGTINIQ